MPEDLLKDTFSSDESLDDEEGSDSDSDVDAKLAEDDVFDVEFLKCYSALKNKDKKIYDENVRFFEDDDSSSSTELASQDDGESNITKNLKKSGPPKMTLLDLQLKAGQHEDELDEGVKPKVDLNEDVSKSYYEKELDEIKKSIEKVGEEVDDSEDDLLVVRGPGEGTSKMKNKIDSLLDKIVDQDGEELAHLKQVWSNLDNLSKEDRFLRDYIINKRYLPTNANVEDDGKQGFFSTNMDDLSDAESEQEETTAEAGPMAHHSDEKDFDKIARIPRNSTKTIRDMVEKQEKRDKRAKKLAREKKKKKAVGDADCEDIIGGMPTRYHYRETEPNDFGLTAEELLMATDEELDQWVNLSECVAYKSREEELMQKQKFDELRSNMELKRRIFKSIYGDDKSQDAGVQDDLIAHKKGKKRKRAGKTDDATDDDTIVMNSQEESKQRKEEKKKKRRRGLNHKKFAKVGVAPDRLLAYGLSKSRLKKNKLL